MHLLSSIMSTSVFLSLVFLIVILSWLQPVKGTSWINVSTLLDEKQCEGITDFYQHGMELVHLHGPCAATDSGKEQMNQDKLRIDWIRRKKTRRNDSDLYSSLSSSSIPISTGLHYVVKVGFGTPSLPQTLIFDTGSSMSWIQCQPCIHCYEQEERMYKPEDSSSFASIGRNTPYCVKEAGKQTDGEPTCTYKLVYVDGSSSEGRYVRDVLNLTSNDNDVLPDFRFGCGNNNTGVFDEEAAGLLGLAPAPGSIVTQTSSKYDGVFYYCIPPRSSSKGRLVFGRDSLPPNIQYTDLLIKSGSDQFYFVDLIAIKVEGKALNVDGRLFSTPGTLLDTGSSFTYLPPTVYEVLKTEFQARMSKYPKGDPTGDLDTCYKLSKNRQNNMKVPDIALQFSNVEIKLDTLGILYTVSQEEVCLAFAAQKKDTDGIVIGSTQQRTFNTVIDVKNKKVGFAAQGC